MSGSVRRTTTTPGGCVAGCDWVGGIAGRRAPSTPGGRVVHPISSSDRQAIHAVARKWPATGWIPALEPKPDLRR